MKVIDDIVAITKNIIRPEFINKKGDLQYLIKLNVNEPVFTNVYTELNNFIEVSLEKAS